jgi:hypothetical protein
MGKNAMMAIKKSRFTLNDKKSGDILRGISSLFSSENWFYTEGVNPNDNFFKASKLLLILYFPFLGKKNQKDLSNKNTALIFASLSDKS